MKKGILIPEWMHGKRRHMRMLSMELFWKLNRVTDLDKRGLNSNCIGKDDGIADPIIDGHDIVPSSQSRSLTPRWAACSTSPNLALFPSLRPLSFFFFAAAFFFPYFFIFFWPLLFFSLSVMAIAACHSSSSSVTSSYSSSF